MAESTELTELTELPAVEQRRLLGEGAVSARQGADVELARIAATLEAATSHGRRRPPVGRVSA